MLKRLFGSLLKWCNLKRLHWIYGAMIPGSEDIESWGYCPNCGLDVGMDDCIHNPNFQGSTSPMSHGCDGGMEWETFWKCSRCGFDWTEDESN